MTQRTVILDYGMGNLHSVEKALEHACQNTVSSARHNIEVSSDADKVAGADRLVFPGVGAIRDCIHELHQLGLDEAIHAFVKTGRPLLAICVGMQALFEHSEENQGVDCLGILPGCVKFFGHPLLDNRGHPLKIPHMGWNQVIQSSATGNEHPIWQGIKDAERFYFVHSFYVEPRETKAIVGETDYGRLFASAVASGNTVAVQFHPEKSQHVGLTLLSNFLAWQS